MKNETGTLLGCLQTTVTFRDGTTETVSVRQLPVRLFPRLRDSMQDEAALVELYCDKPAGWADTLTLDSHEAVLIVANDLNSDFFSRWLEREKTRLERATAESSYLLEQLSKASPAMAERVLDKVVSQTSSPKSPSPVD